MDNEASALASLKPFRLVKFFTFTSLAVILISTLALTWMLSNQSKRVLLFRSEAYAKVFAENLSHQVSLRFLLPMDKRYGQISLRNPEQFKLLDDVVKNTIHGMKINAVTIYGVKSNVVSYSTVGDRVGREGVGGKGYELALKGESTSQLCGDASLINLLPIAEPVSSRVITYVPMRLGKPFTRDTSYVVGVLEIEQDMADDLESIIRLQGTIFSTSLLIMTALFIALRFLVARADSIIEARAQERRRLEKQLDQAERLAGLGKMVASVAHEIKNPLGIVRSTAEILKNRLEKIAPGNEQLAGIIVEETSRLDRVVREFLDFARPNEARMAALEVNGIVERLLEFVKPELVTHDIRADLQLEEIPRIAGDHDQIYQALLNIVMNSIQAMNEGGELLIKSRPAANKIILEISDSGCGMDEKVREQIFQAFYTTKSRGTGLGLAIVKNILDRHQAEIAILSTPGKGTTFAISFPAG